MWWRKTSGGDLAEFALQEKGSVLGKHRLSKEGHRAGRQRGYMMPQQAEERGGQRQEPSLDKLPQSLSWNLWSSSYLVFRPLTHKRGAHNLLHFLRDVCKHRTCAGSPSLSA